MNSIDIPKVFLPYFITCANMFIASTVEVADLPAQPFLVL
jgi:hypothetical protein